MKIDLVITKDGSHSLYVPELNEHYHSMHGAVQESDHVYIKHGLEFFAQTADTIKLLEIGFGTGLNVFLTFLKNCELKKRIYYTTLEASPLDPTLISALNYIHLPHAKRYENIFNTIHSSNWGDIIELPSQFSLTKLNTKIEEIALESDYNVIYFDAFAPTIQPELWTTSIFKKLYHSLHTGGILVTYCAKGQVKRNLKECGFSVEALEGPPGKREMIRAKKN